MHDQHYGTIVKNPEITIRAYEASDLPTLSAIWFKASQSAHAFLGSERLQRHRELVETVYLPDTEVWVATRNGKTVGFIGLIDSFIGALFVAPNAQGSGVGYALAAHALALKGRLELQVYQSNENALAFYRRLGFAETGRVDEDDEGLPFAVVKMRLTR